MMARPAEKDVEKVTNLFKDVSIEPEVEPKADSFILKKPEKLSNLSSIDSKTIILIELLNEYEQIANDNYRSNFANGFLNLSRANYSNGSFTKKFGLHSFDMREYNACKSVETLNGVYEIVDLLAIQKKTEHLQKNEKIKKDKASDNEISSKSTSIQLDPPSGELKSKYKRKFQSNKHIEDNKKLKDPILQFGGLVPYQLKKAQEFFVEGLNNSVQLINLGKKINELINDIKLLKETSEKNQEV